MRLLIATDAWYPQVCGVVRTLGATIDAISRLGIEVSVVSPDLFRTIPLPLYPQILLAIASPRAIARRISDFRPDVVHVVTEGPLGWLARRWCIANGMHFASSYTTRFPEYSSARVPIPASWSYRVLRGFHRAASVTLVATPRLADELRARGFSNLALWPRGVDADLFSPVPVSGLDFPRPIFLTASRLAVEKNIEAFLDLDLPGSKVVVGSGPSEAALRRSYPDVHFLGQLHDAELVRAIASADVFVFPSRTDTFGVVQLEALACGVPVAAYPVPRPLDAIGEHPVGCLNDDLHAACIAALAIDRRRCREYALTRSWGKVAAEYIGQLEVLSRRNQRRAA